jgi:alkylhydroperoxidase/carboxymuconolactone decarboxylase family protein YurZ
MISERARVTVEAPVSDIERTLLKLAIGDDAYIQRMLSSQTANRIESRLDARTHSLVRLGALIAADAASPSYLEVIESARESGASDEELVGCLIATLPALGAVRVTSAAPKLGLALNYDVAAALEESASPLG